MFMQVYGIDLSMEKFDVNFIDEKGKEKKKQVKNRLSAISKFLEAVRITLYNVCYTKLLRIMDFTWVKNARFPNSLYGMRVPEHPLLFMIQGDKMGMEKIAPSR